MAYGIDELKKAVNLGCAFGNVGAHIGDNTGIIGKIGLLLSIKDELSAMSGFDYALAAQEVMDLDDSEAQVLKQILVDKLNFSGEMQAMKERVVKIFGGLSKMLMGLDEVIESVRS